MSSFLLPVAIIFVLFMSTYGWGELLLRGALKCKQASAAYSSAVGCAVWIPIGGILNVTHSVTGFALNALIVAGIGVALFRILPSIRSASRERLQTDAVPKLIVIAVTGFFALSLLPTNAFNYHDDFHTYLVYPFRMLQTGTAGGGVDDLVGYGTLTAQSFLLSPLLLHLPISFVNGFDLIFCFLVSGLLIDDIGKRVGLHWAFRVVPVLAFIVIHPQYVNISSLYSGSLMILGLIYASMLAVEVEPGEFQPLLVRLLPMALFASSLAVLKLTFLSFVGTYVILFIIFLPALGWETINALRAGAFLLLVSSLLAAPWLAISINSYTEMIFRAIANISGSATSTYDGSDVSKGPIALFSVSRLFWGGSFIGYLLMLAIIVGASVVSMWLFWKGPTRKTDRNLIIAVSAFGAALVSTVLLSYQVRPDLAIRYTCPLLIAIFPMTISLLGSSLSLRLPEGRIVQLSGVGAVLIAGQALVVGQFIDVFAANLAKSFKHRTLLSFPIGSERYFAYIHTALLSSTRETIRAAQNTVPEGEPLFAWLATPFHLDFARNRVISLDAAGLDVLAGRMDFGSGREVLTDYLRSRRIRYLMWHKSSPGMKNEATLKRELNTRLYAHARNSLILIESIRWLMAQHTTLFEDEEIVVIDIGGN